MITMKRLTAMLLAVVLFVGLLPTTMPEANAAISTSTFATKVQSFISDSRWKNGIAWADAQKPKLSKWSSTGCCAYAADFAAYVYGSTSAAWTSSDFTKYTDLNEIRAGDIIHTSNHWFVVLERNGNTFRTAEGNFDDKTRVCNDGWGIKNGKIYNLKATDGERTFEYGYHYNFSDVSSTPTYSSSQIYHNIDMSAAVLASRTNQQVSGDCAVVSMATVEAYMYGATSTAEKNTVYNALVSKNSDNDYAYWSNCGYVSHSTINWATVYENLSRGYPVIVHRPASGSKVEHWAVVAGYKGSTTTLEKDKFIIVDVYHGSGGTDIYTSGAWRGSVSIDRMVTRKNGIAITSLSSIRMAINHPATVHQYSEGHGVYGYVTSNTNLSSIQFLVTNANTGVNVYNKTVTPNAKSYLIYNLDSEFTFAKWPVGEYFFTVIAKTANSVRNYQTYFQIVSGWPTTLPTRAYTFSFNSNGGSGSVATQTVNYGGTLTIPTTQPTRTGYTFVGWNVKRTTDGTWYCDANGWCTDTQINASGAVRRVYTPGEKYPSLGFEWVKGCFANKDYTFYAVWEADEAATYTISYNANGGTGAPANQTKTYGVSLTLSSSTPTRSGYTFLGWANSAGATSAAYQPGAVFTANANTTLYAVWKANTYTVTYNANGGSGAPASQIKTAGTTLMLSSVNPTREGYSFKGWATSAAGSVAYQPGSSFTTDADTILYAVWEQNVVTTEPQIIVENLNTQAGQTICVPVRIMNNPGVAYVKLKLDYSDTLELISAENQNVLIGTYTTSKTVDVKPYVIQWMGADNATGNGNIVLLTFKVADDAEDGSYNVTITCEEAYNAEYEDVSFEVTNATVTVASYLPGDTNGDGKVNGKDGVMLAQYLAEWDVTINESAADVNGDGKVNGKDGVLLAQYLAEWEVTLG